MALSLRRSVVDVMQSSDATCSTSHCSVDMSLMTVSFSPAMKSSLLTVNGVVVSALVATDGSGSAWTDFTSTVGSAVDGAEPAGG